MSPVLASVKPLENARTAGICDWSGASKGVAPFSCYNLAHSGYLETRAYFAPKLPWRVFSRLSFESRTQGAFRWHKGGYAGSLTGDRFSLSMSAAVRCFCCSSSAF